MRLIRYLLLVFLFLPLFAYGQGSRKDDVATKNLVTGLAAAPGALITVCTSAGVGVPCTPLASIYSDVGLTSLATNGTAANAVSCSVGPTTNPCLADSNGNYGFYASPGRYIVTIAGAGTTGKSVVYTLPCDPSATCTVSGTTLFAAGPICDVKAYGALGDFSHDDTVAIVAAYTACAAVGGITYFPLGTYRAVPATVMAAASGNVTVAFPMVSNMHLWGEHGATIKLANAQSTDASPKDLGLFFTNTPLTNISFYGLIMDMNYPSNTISPSRPSSYNLFDFSQIRTSGNNGRVDDMRIEYCQFLNNPGTNEIVAGESNTAGITLGKRWIVTHNLFKNNGADTNDSTAIFGWVNEMTVHDNMFWEDNPYGTVGHTGSFTAHEVHGVNHTFHDNTVRNYYQAVFVSNNYTSLVYNADIHDNVTITTFGVVSLFNSNANSQGVQDVRIHDNVSTLIDQTYSGAPSVQEAFSIEPFLSINNIDIYNNHVSKQGAQTIAALFCSVVPQTGQSFTNIRVNNNTGINLTQGINFRTDIGGGTLGYVEASGNHFHNFQLVAGSNPNGVTAIATNTIKDLKIDGNSFVDDQGVPTFQRGILLQAGTITNLYVGPQIYKGLTTANYAEAGGVTITNRLGVALPLGMPVTWTPNSGLAPDTGISRSAAGVVAVGNGTQGDASGTTKSKLLSPTANPAASGIIALAAADQQCWRNPGNSADNCLSEDASGALNYAGTPVSGVFTSVNVTPVTANTNTAADQNGMSITVTAGALNSVKRTLLVQLAGVYSTPAASTSVITDKLKLCTVSGCGSGTVITLATWTTTALGGIQATNDPFNCVLNSTTQTAGASAAFEAHGNLTIDLAALATAAESIFADGNTATVGTIDSTVQLFLQHTKAFSNASASNSFTDRQMFADTVD